MNPKIPKLPKFKVGEKVVYNGKITTIKRVYEINGNYEYKLPMEDAYKPIDEEKLNKII